MDRLSQTNQVKLGNTIIYLAKKCGYISKTKLLKLLYLIEERCALEYHMPFLGLTYKVWQAGPVADLVYDDICNDIPILKSHIRLFMDNNCIYIVPAHDFDDSEFSDVELSVMEYIVNKYGNKTASELVHHLHSKGSLWTEIAKENGLLDLFYQGKRTSSKEIDFTKRMSTKDAEFYAELLRDQRAANEYAHYV